MIPKISGEEWTDSQKQELQYWKWSKKIGKNEFNKRTVFIKYFSEFACWFEESIGEMNFGIVADIGCGATLGALPLIKEAIAKFAIDSLMDEYVKMHKKEYDKRFENNICDTYILRNCKTENLDFPDESFDEIFCMNMLDHVEDSEKSFKEICRVLKKGGYLFFNVDLRPDTANSPCHKIRLTEQIIDSYAEDKSNDIFFLHKRIIDIKAPNAGGMKNYLAIFKKG